MSGNPLCTMLRACRTRLFRPRPKKIGPRSPRLFLSRLERSAWISDLIDAVKGVSGRRPPTGFVDVYLIGDIEKDTARSVIERLRELANDNTRPMTIYINSAGGNVTDGLAIHDAIARSSAADIEVTIVVQGWRTRWARSPAGGGSVGRRLSYPHSWIMIHEPAKWAGWQSTSAAAQHLDRLKQMQAQIYQILADAIRQAAAEDHPRHQAHGLLPRREEGGGARASIDGIVEGTVSASGQNPYAASRLVLNSSSKRATLPATECSDGDQPSARARGLARADRGRGRRHMGPILARASGQRHVTRRRAAFWHAWQSNRRYRRRSRRPRRWRERRLTRLGLVVDAKVDVGQVPAHRRRASGFPRRSPEPAHLPRLSAYPR